MKNRLIRYFLSAVFDIFKPHMVNVLGRRMFINPDDRGISKDLFMEGVYEPFETKTIEKIIRKGMIAVDFGANVGYYTLLMADLVGKEGRVYAFEPVPSSFLILRKNLRNFTNVTLLQSAVSNKSGKIKFSIDEGNFGGSNLRNVGGRVIEVDCTKPDSFFKNRKVDFIKMDIEGAEPLAMEGMEKLLGNNPNIQIITEVGAKFIREIGRDPEDYLDFLLHRFEVFRIDEKKKKLIKFTKKDIQKVLDVIPGYQNFYCKSRGNN